jgi:hypothetical protein
MSQSFQHFLARGRAAFPGLLACFVVAMAGKFLSEHYSAPLLNF